MSQELYQQIESWKRRLKIGKRIKNPLDGIFI
jgi:hypothetical protein